MACLVVSRKFSFFLAHVSGLFLSADNNFYHGVLNLGHLYKSLGASCGKQRRFVEQICKVGARKSGCRFCNHREVNTVCKRFVACMHTKYCFTRFKVGHIHNDLTVKSSRTQERTVQYVGAVSGSNDYYSLVSRKSIHLHKQLVKSLFSFVVTAAETCTSLTAYCVNLVYKYNARCGFFCLFKQITHSGRTDSDKHLNKVRTANGEKGNTRLAGNSLRKQSFTRSRRSHKQHSARYLCAEFMES